MIADRIIACVLHGEISSLRKAMPRPVYEKRNAEVTISIVTAVVVEVTTRSQTDFFSTPFY